MTWKWQPLPCSRRIALKGSARLHQLLPVWKAFGRCPDVTNIAGFKRVGKSARLVLSDSDAQSIMREMSQLGVGRMTQRGSDWEFHWEFKQNQIASEALDLIEESEKRSARTDEPDATAAAKPGEYSTPEAQEGEAPAQQGDSPATDRQPGVAHFRRIDDVIKYDAMLARVPHLQEEFRRMRCRVSVS